jgi:PAS domain S-box-containing protein
VYAVWPDNGGMEGLRQPLELLEAFECVSDGVFAVDQQMRVVYWNFAAEHIFGVDAAAALGRRCDEIVAGYETSGATLCMPDCRVMGCARRGHAAETYDLARTDAAGNKQWLNVTMLVLRGRRRASTLAVHLVRDVTKRQQVEERAGTVLSALSNLGSEPNLAALTKREAEVLRLLACGLTNAGMAETLGISRATIRNHIEHLLGKLGVHSKLEAVVYAAQHGLV